MKKASAVPCRCWLPLRPEGARRAPSRGCGRPRRLLLTHCCGQRDSKDSRSFSHWEASSPCLSKHCQNSSRAPQQAFLSSIVGADIFTADLNTERPLPETPGRRRTLAASTPGPDAALPAVPRHRGKGVPERQGRPRARTAPHRTHPPAPAPAPASRGEGRAAGSGVTLFLVRRRSSGSPGWDWQAGRLSRPRGPPQILRAAAVPSPQALPRCRCPL